MCVCVYVCACVCVCVCVCVCTYNKCQEVWNALLVSIYFMTSTHITNQPVLVNITKKKAFEMSV